MPPFVSSGLTPCPSTKHTHNSHRRNQRVPMPLLLLLNLRSTSFRILLHKAGHCLLGSLLRRRVHRFCGIDFVFVQKRQECRELFGATQIGRKNLALEFLFFAVDNILVVCARRFNGDDSCAHGDVVGLIRSPARPSAGVACPRGQTFTEGLRKIVVIVLILV